MWNPYKNITPVTRRRLNNFKKNRRAFVSLRIFLLFSYHYFQFLINDEAQYYYKVNYLCTYYYRLSRKNLTDSTVTYKDPFISDEIEANGWILWPLVSLITKTIKIIFEDSISNTLHAPSFLIEDGECQELSRPSMIKVQYLELELAWH